MKKFSLLIIPILLLTFGCVYYNTFFLAKKNFKEAEKARKRSGQEIVRTGGKYQKAIEKASVVLEFHPDSKYVDDALYVIGRSFYHTGEFHKAEIKFRELLATYPESEYAKESLFYLGKTRFMKEDFLGARESFEKVRTTIKDRGLLSESMFMLAEIYFTQEAYDLAIPVFTEYLETYGKGKRVAEIQFKIAQSHYELEDYMTAKDAFIEVPELDADDTLKYQALYNAGGCFYQVDMPDSGLVIFEELADDEKNYAKMPDLYLQIAKGHELAGDFEAAIGTHRKLIEEYPRLEQTAIAFFDLGIIYQEQYYDLPTAKAMYDSSTAIRSNAPISKEAFSRSADIGKLDSYREGMSAEVVEDAVESQYLLAELYLTQLNQPDSALNEYNTLVDSFPESKYAPRALMAIGWLHDNVYVDSSHATQYYDRILQDYPNSDLVPEVLLRLGIDDGMTDYDYPAKRYAEAENVLFASGDYLAANEIFQSIVDDFPESDYAAKSQLAIAYSLSNFHQIADPDSGDSGVLIVDSTYILAFQEVVNKFKDSDYARSANEILAGAGARVKTVEQETGSEGDTLFASEEFDSAAYMDSISRAIEEEIEELPLAPKTPTTIGEFNYPISAYNDLWQGEIVFKIKIDFTGKVTKWEILRGSGIEDIDFEAEESIRETYFNPADIDPLLYDSWFVYRYAIRLPEGLGGIGGNPNQ